MRRYLKIYCLLLKLNFAKLLVYRADFISSLIGNFGWSLFIVFSMLLLTSKTATVYGWNRYELLLLAGMYNLIISFFYVFFTSNFNEMSDTIHYGKLDAILMKPLDSQFLLTCQNIGYARFIRVLVGLFVVCYCVTQLHIPVTLFTILLFLLVIVFSITILYSFWFLVMTITIWHSNLENLVNLLYDTNHISRFPPEMYKGASMILFILLFPLTFTMVSPAKVLLSKATLGDILLPLGISSCLFILSRKFWKYALKSYTSASG